MLVFTTAYTLGLWEALFLDLGVYMWTVAVYFDKRLTFFSKALAVIKRLMKRNKRRKRCDSCSYPTFLSTCTFMAQTRE